MRGVLLLFICGLFSLTGMAAIAHENPGHPATPDDLRGMGSLGCSGALIRFGRIDDSSAVLLTAGHCISKNPIAAGDAVVDGSYDGEDLFVFIGGIKPEKVKASRVLYATMTGVDLALIELKSTYRELETKGAIIYDLAENPADSRDEVAVSLIAGAVSEKRLCKISHNVDTLIDGDAVSKNAISLEDPCMTTALWTGTPLLDANTQKIVGVLSSSNAAGELCTVGNPCEVNTMGEREAYVNRSYASRIHGISACLFAGEISLSLPGCMLQAPLPKKDRKFGTNLWPHS